MTKVPLATYHDALRQVGLCDDYRAQSFEDIDDSSITVSGTKGTSDIAKRRVQPFHIELVLERHWHSVKGTDELAILLSELIESSRLDYGVFKANFRQAVCLANDQ